MKLQSLQIQLNASYDDNPGRYRGKVCWEQKDDGKIETVLPAEISERLLIFLAPLLTEFTQRSMQTMQKGIEISVEESRRLTDVTV
jgi:hypothetical protein